MCAGAVGVHKLARDVAFNQVTAPSVFLCKGLESEMKRWLVCSCPIVFTSYNLQEAEDDYDTIAEWGGFEWVWEEAPGPCPGSAPYANRDENVVHMQCNNSYWQCVKSKK